MKTLYELIIHPYHRNWFGQSTRLKMLYFLWLNFTKAHRWLSSP